MRPSLRLSPVSTCNFNYPYQPAWFCPFDITCSLNRFLFQLRVTIISTFKLQFESIISQIESQLKLTSCKFSACIVTHIKLQLQLSIILSRSLSYPSYQVATLIFPFVSHAAWICSLNCARRGSFMRSTVATTISSGNNSGGLSKLWFIGIVKSKI